MPYYTGTSATLTYNSSYASGKIKTYYTACGTSAATNLGWVVSPLVQGWNLVSGSAASTSTSADYDCTIGSAWKTWTTGGGTTTLRWEPGYEHYDAETGTAWCGYTYPNAKVARPRSRNSQLKEIIKSRMAPAIHVSRTPLTPHIDVREMRARETLRRVIGEQKYKLYIKHGFLSARSPRSDKVYQIFPGHGITKVYQQGNLVERLCVVLQGNFPPTDSLIMRFLMILNNEDEFRSLAVKHSVNLPATRWIEDNRSLIEIARNLDSIQVTLDPETFEPAKRVFVA